MIKKATFGAGCFWHVQYVFSQLKGVTQTAAGYMGGDEKKYPNPTYEQVCTDRTGYAEVVQLDYDPDGISYDKLLEVFWKEHNPTQKDRQGPDVGTQYRSVIFYHDDNQKAAAERSKVELQKKLGYVATDIVPASTFFRAEEYHQDYVKKTGKDSCPR